MIEDNYVARLRERIVSNIATYGRHVMGVFADERGPPFSYTIGNAGHGLPELLMIGLLDNISLNLLSDLMDARGRKFDNGEIVSLGGAQPVCIIDADDKVKDEYTIQARHYTTGDYEVQQVIIPDKRGRFPWDEGCDPPYCRMPVYRRKRGYDA